MPATSGALEDSILAAMAEHISAKLAYRKGVSLRAIASPSYFVGDEGLVTVKVGIHRGLKALAERIRSIG
jgi:hypothetical protein